MNGLVLCIAVIAFARGDVLPAQIETARADRREVVALGQPSADIETSDGEYHQKHRTTLPSRRFGPVPGRPREAHTHTGEAEHRREASGSRLWHATENTKRHVIPTKRDETQSLTALTLGKIRQGQPRADSRQRDRHQGVRLTVLRET